MDRPGLGWSADRGWPGLVFARGVSVDQVLRAFGADPDEAVQPDPAAHAIAGQAPPDTPLQTQA
jgi:hypothetical protein